MFLARLEGGDHTFRISPTDKAAKDIFWKAIVTSRPQPLRRRWLTHRWTKLHNKRQGYSRGLQPMKKALEISSAFSINLL